MDMKDMKNFRNLINLLEEYAPRKEITQAEALGMMSAICNDIRFDTRKAVENCPAGDLDQLIDGLYALGFTINMLYDRHEADILGQGQSESEEEMWSRLRTVQDSCEEARGRLQQADGAIQQLRRKEAELRELMGEEQNKQSKVAEYRRKVMTLEQELDQMKNTDLAQLVARYTALEQEKQEKQALLQQMQEQVQVKDRELQSLRAHTEEKERSTAAVTLECESLRQRLEACCTAGEQRRAEIQRMSQQLEEAEQAAGDMMREYVLTKTRLESQEADNATIRDEQLLRVQELLRDAEEQYQQLNQELGRYKSQREEIGTRILQTGTLIEAKQLDLEHKQRQFNEKTRELERLNLQVSAIAADLAPMLEEIERRKEHVEGMNKEQIEEDLRLDLEHWQAQIDELEGKRQQIQQLQQQIAENVQQTEACRQQLEALSQQKAQQEGYHQELVRNVETMDRELALLGTPEYADKIGRLQNQQQVLQLLRENLEQCALDMGLSWTADMQDNLTQTLQYSENVLQQLSRAVREYAAVWQSGITQ